MTEPGSIEPDDADLPLFSQAVAVTPPRPDGRPPVVLAYAVLPPDRP